MCKKKRKVGLYFKLLHFEKEKQDLIKKIDDNDNDDDDDDAFSVVKAQVTGRSWYTMMQPYLSLAHSNLLIQLLFRPLSMIY